MDTKKMTPGIATTNPRCNSAVILAGHLREFTPWIATATGTK